MVKVCVVKNCPSGRKNKSGKSVSFFRPSTTIKLQRWAQSLAIDLKPSDYVCQHHFKEEHIKMYEEIKIGNVVHLVHSIRKTLKEGALPVIEYQSRLSIEPQQQKQLLQKQNLSHHEQIQPPYQQQHHQQNPVKRNNTNDEAIKLSNTFKNMKHNIKKNSMLPAYWFYAEKPKSLEFMRIDPKSKKIINHILLNEDFSITVICSNNKEVTLGDKIMSYNDVNRYLKSVEKWPLCVGTQIDKKKYSSQCKGLIIGDESYKRFQVNPRCKSCRALRNQLLTRSAVINVNLAKSVACKWHTGSQMKQCSHLKEIKNWLRQGILKAKLNCARKSRLVVEKAINDLPVEFQDVVTSCFEAAQKKNSKGKRYTSTLEWIYECILIRLKSRNTYELLRQRNILPLPSLATLSKFIPIINFSAYGFQPITFKSLKKKCERITPSYKQGVILIDEMNLSENIAFDAESMKINGFVNLGQNTPDNLKDKSADHALVFKFVPFRGRWVQTLGCFLSRNSCTSVPLHKLILECIVLMENCGIHIHTVMTDGATWNRGVWKILGINENNLSCEHPCNRNQRLWMLSDFNHLVIIVY